VSQRLLGQVTDAVTRLVEPITRRILQIQKNFFNPPRSSIFKDQMGKLPASNILPFVAYLVNSFISATPLLLAGNGQRRKPGTDLCMTAIN
jgi:hypothetical protein